MSINIKCLLKSKCDKLSCTFSFKESHSLVEMYIICFTGLRKNYMVVL